MDKAELRPKFRPNKIEKPGVQTRLFSLIRYDTVRLCNCRRLYHIYAQSTFKRRFLSRRPPLRQGEIDEPRPILLKPTLPTQLRLSFSLGFSIGRRSDSFENAERVE